MEPTHSTEFSETANEHAGFQTSAHTHGDQAPHHHNRTPVEDDEVMPASSKNSQAKKKKQDGGSMVVSKRMSSGVYQITFGEDSVTLSLGKDQLWNWVDDNDSSKVGEPTRLKRSAKQQVVDHLTHKHHSHSNGSASVQDPEISQDDE